MHPQDRLFCEIAVQLQLLTRQQATSCMQAQEREVGQSVATVALALGYMDQTAVDAVLHQQQRVLSRRREAREASRVQREVESRAAAGVGPGGAGMDAAMAPTDRPPGPSWTPSASGAAPRREAHESVPAAAARSAEAGPRYSGTFNDARHSGAARHSGYSPTRSSAAPADDRQQASSDAPDEAWDQIEWGEVHESEAALEGWDDSALSEGHASEGQASADRGGGALGSEALGEARGSAARSGEARGSAAPNAAGSQQTSNARSSASPGGAGGRGAASEGRGSAAPNVAGSQGTSGWAGAGEAAIEGWGSAARSGGARTSAGPSEAWIAGTSGAARESGGGTANDKASSAAPGGGASSEGRRSRGTSSAAPGGGAANDKTSSAAPGGGASSEGRGSRTSSAAPGGGASSEGRSRSAGPAAHVGRGPGALIGSQAAADDTHDVRDTIDERPPLRRSLLGMHDEELEGRQTVPLERTSPSASSLPPSAAERSSTKPPARASSSLPPSATGGAVAQSARGTLLESSGMEQQRRELASPQRHATGRPIPSGRDWRNPSRPPPAAEGFEIEMPLRPHHSLAPKPRTSRPPADERRSSRPPAAIAAPTLDAPKHIDRALELCAQHGASDYHLHSGALPRMRIDGTLRHLTANQPASELAVERVLAEVLGDEERMQLTLDGELRVIHQTESGIRARLTAFVSEQGSNVQLHVLPIGVPSAEQLGLSTALNILREKPWGLAICSGPVGSGITSTLWALAQGLAVEHARYSVSLESPLELNVQCGVGLFEQREVGRHVESYAAGIACALAEGADLIVVSDLLAPGAFEASLHAARARCLVIAGMRAGSSFAALRRLLNEAQGDAELLRRSLADGLRLLMHQRLLPRRIGPGSVAAFELVLGNGRLMQHLRRAELLQLAAALETSHDPELFTLRDALNDLVRSSVISSEAMRSALGIDRGCLEG